MCGSCRFNEAAAFQPRKIGRAVGTSPDRECFNEAAAFQPRKISSERAYPLLGTPGFNEAAAFQPRKMSLGGAFRLGIWSCFNEAAAFQPRKMPHSTPSTSSATPLQ